MAPSSSTVPIEPRKVFRQRGALAAGWFVIGVLAIVVVLYAVTIRGGALRPAMGCVGAALLAWVVLVRPAVVLSAAGVQIHNLVRDVAMPWPQVDVVESRWNLCIYTPEDRRFSAWAISAQRPRGQATGLGAVISPGRLGAHGSPGAITQRPASSGDVADQIRDAREDFDRAFAKGVAPAQEEAVVIRPALPAIAASVAAVILIALAILL